AITGNCTVTASFSSSSPPPPPPPSKIPAPENLHIVTSGPSPAPPPPSPPPSPPPPPGGSGSYSLQTVIGLGGFAPADEQMEGPALQATPNLYRLAWGPGGVIYGHDYNYAAL